MADDVTVPVDSDITDTNIKTDTDLKDLLASTQALLNDAIKSRDASKLKLNTLEQAKIDSEQNSLLENEKFKELYEQKDEQLSTLKKKVDSDKISNAIKSELDKLGITSTNTALALIDRSKIMISDSNNVIGIDSALTKLKEDHEIIFHTAPTAPDIKPPGEKTEGEDIKFADLDMSKAKDRALFKSMRKQK